MKEETILVVDDNREIVYSIGELLKYEGYHVVTAYDGMEALEVLESADVDLILLDVMMPRLNGLSALMKLRERHKIPVIILSAKTEESDKVSGLTLGADDYITKPFNPLEVTARVKTQLRRYKNYNRAGREETEKTEYDIRGLVINKASHKCFLYDEPVSLTPLEFSILWYLCERKGQVVSSEELYEAVWGDRYLENSNNTVMAHIGRLREKLKEPPRKPKFIKTVWGVGYKLED